MYQGPGLIQKIDNFIFNYQQQLYSDKLENLWIQDIKIVKLTITMSEEPLNRKDDLQDDVSDAANDTESTLDEAGDKIKAGAKAMANKIKDPDKDTGTEYNKEKFKEEVKDY